MGEIRIKSGNLYPISIGGDSWSDLNDATHNNNNGELVVNMMGTDNNSGVYSYSDSVIRTVHKDLSTYSWSVEIKADSPGKILLGFQSDGVKTLNITNEYQKFTFNNQSFTSDKAFVIYNRAGVANTIYLRNFMLNLGSTALPYQPYFLNKPAHQFTNGQFVDIPTHHYINNRWQGELTSQSPLKFRADGEMLDWRIEGASGGNLFDISANLIPHLGFSSQSGGIVSIKSTNNAIGFYVKCQPDKYYTLSRAANTNNRFSIGFTADEPVDGTSLLSYTPFETSEKSVTALSPSNANYVCAYLTNQNDPITDDLQLMLNEGETALPYEPYGSGVGDWDETAQKYRIPVTVNGVTTALYTDHQLMDGDSIDYATDQTQIPIATGNNTLTVDTAVKPKTVFIKFEG